MLKEPTLKLLKKHINSGAILFKNDESKEVSIDLSMSQVKTLLKHEFGHVKPKDYEEKVTELLNILVTNILEVQGLYESQD